MDQTDNQLIDATLSGSVSAWETLVRRHETRVYNIGLRLMHNPDDAMDLTQEVFLGVYRNLYRFRGDSQFSTWLFRIVHNKAIDMIRRRQSGPDMETGFDELPEPADSHDGPQEQYLESEFNERIAKFLSRLPPAQRVIVELKVFQSLTFDEIAPLQNIPVNTAKTRFYTALKNLKGMMEVHA
ncbi:MAG: RNA polymerase sigma factor [Pseudohongiella sp.]|nr:RNA polymerase sigma factor [Pseudohongiella sp.]MDO9519983.1 RNA polymerase sigma factor [Pseudohongiella sp.]MDP2127146.1 RNA polymerase sigma factor [Pseudohongiella sp.]